MRLTINVNVCAGFRWNNRSAPKYAIPYTYPMSGLKSFKILGSAVRVAVRETIQVWSSVHRTSGFLRWRSLTGDMFAGYRLLYRLAHEEITPVLMSLVIFVGSVIYFRCSNNSGYKSSLIFSWFFIMNGHIFLRYRLGMNFLLMSRFSLLGRSPLFNS